VEGEKAVMSAAGGGERLEGRSPELHGYCARRLGEQALGAVALAIERGPVDPGRFGDAARRRPGPTPLVDDRAHRSHEARVEGFTHRFTIHPEGEHCNISVA